MEAHQVAVVGEVVAVNRVVSKAEKLLSLSHIVTVCSILLPSSIETNRPTFDNHFYQITEGVFIARGKEDALVSRNLVPGSEVYGEKRISVEVSIKWHSRHSNRVEFQFEK